MLILLLLSAAAVLHAQNPSLELQKAIDDTFERVGALQPMRPADGDAVLRRRTGPEILQDGRTSGCGDNAIAADYLLRQRGYETQFVDGAQISTESLANNFSGHAVVAVRDGPGRPWVRVDPTRREYAFPWTEGDTTFYGNYWIGYRGPLAGYPAHDPESLKKFYRDTLDRIPKEVLDEKLFRFRFTPDPHVELPPFLRVRDNILAEHGVHPRNEIAIRIVEGDDSARSTFEYRDGGWVLTFGRRSAGSLGLVTYIEQELNDAREHGRPLGIVSRSVDPRALTWSAIGGAWIAAIALLFWRRHPYWACQLLGWGALPAIAIAVKWQEVDNNGIAALFIFFAVGLLLTHLLRAVMRLHGWLAMSTRALLARLTVATVTLGAVHAGFEILRGLAFKDGQPSVVMALADWGISTAFIAGWAWLYVLLTAPRREREAQVRLQLDLREAELRALEAQINPHFLFNCLNSIRALVSENPARSQDMLTRLANILRYNLRHDLEHTVPLRSEIEIASDYLALEAARYEERLRVEMSIDPDAGDVPVPPMLLQSLIENALKHGIAPLPSGGDLLIRAQLVGDSMLMEVENPGQIAAALETTQLGLANIRERLRILYHGRATFELKSRDGRVAATVLIPRTV